MTAGSELQLPPGMTFADIDAAHVELARIDPEAFISYVLRDERTGAGIEMAPIHSSWQHQLSTHNRVLVWSHIESGKTSQITIGRTLYELGRNPNMSIVILSNTQDQAKKIVRTVARYIEQSEELHRVFPHLKRGDPWTTTQLYVDRTVTRKDPSVQASGVHGNILGARIDLLILDDVLDYENCRTEELRKDLYDWYHAILVGRLTADSRVWVVGTAFHPSDLLHRLASADGWRALRYPVIDPATGQSRWPDRWPLSRINAKRVELGPLEFARQMLCHARDDGESRFRKEWIDMALMRGKGRRLAYALDQVPFGFRVYTGVDLAVQRHASADESVLFTLLVDSNGGDREVLNIEAGKWSGPEIVQRIIDNHRRYHSVVIVENNAAQDFILQFTRGSAAVPIKPFTTGRNKANPEFGVESIAAEMANSKWIIPNDGTGQLDPQVALWIQEMLYYDPKAHTGDRLMASWFAREGARQGTRKVQFGRIDFTSR